MIPVMEAQTAAQTGRDGSSCRPTLRDVIARMSEVLKKSGVESHHLDAQLIVTHALGLERIDSYRHPDLFVAARRRAAVLTLIQRRASGVPTAYITGRKEFWSLSVSVDERVLIPRPETELLVEESLAVLGTLSKDPSILEVGTGSGAVSMALAVELPRARVVSTDISEDALTVAKANAGAHGLTDRIVFIRGDLFDPVNTDGRFDLIVSNPPYLTEEEMRGLPPEVRAEPYGALSGGRHGLSVIERLIAGAPDHLEIGGFLVFEIGAGQEHAARQLIEETHRLGAIRITSDYAGHPRIVSVQRVK